MKEERNPLAVRLEAAASALQFGDALDELRPPAPSLLHYLAYDDGDVAKSAGRARLLRAAAKFRRLFLLPVPDASGVVFFGGEADPAVLGAGHAGAPIGNLAGSGLAPQRAFEACAGEGIEYLSQFVQNGDPIESMPFAAQRDCHDTDTKNFLSKVFEASKVAENRSIAWIKARRLPDGAETWFPLDLCCRRPAGQQNFAPPLKLSTGCAAGETFEAAALRAALELVERDAAALWWRGGCRGHPIAPDSDAGQAAAALLAAARQGKGDRQTWLLDITTDIEIPAVAALSAREDGYGFAFGFAARLAIADAARAALFELFQVELGQHVVAAKRHESGEGALNENDRRQWRRASLFNTRGCALLEPDGAPNPASPGVPDEPTAGLRHIVERLHAHDIRAYALDLTRPDFGVPVVRVLAPGLQLEPCQIAGARLAAAIRATGGGGVHTGGLPLL